MNIQRSFTLLFLCALFTTASAQKYTSKSEAEVKTVWNGVTFTSFKTIAENISGIENFSYLSGVLEDEGNQILFSEEEMITFFAPTNAAFDNLNKEQRESLLNSNEETNNLLKFIAVPGRLDLVSIRRAIRKNNGDVFFNTLSGEKLGAKMIDGEVFLFDSENNTAKLSASDFYHKNGLFHVVDRLVFPKSK